MTNLQKHPGLQHLHSTSAVIDIALAVAAEGRSLSDIADVLHLLDRENDEMLWAGMTELARLVGESDPRRTDLGMGCSESAT